MILLNQIKSTQLDALWLHRGAHPSLIHRNLHAAFPGVEKCPAGWPIRRQEPDPAACQRVRRKAAFYSVSCWWCRRRLSGGGRSFSG